MSPRLLGIPWLEQVSTGTAFLKLTILPSMESQLLLLQGASCGPPSLKQTGVNLSPHAGHMGSHGTTFSPLIATWPAWNPWETVLCPLAPPAPAQLHLGTSEHCAQCWCADLAQCRSDLDCLMHSFKCRPLLVHSLHGRELWDSMPCQMPYF